jgi:hypothetical protein
VFAGAVILATHLLQKAFDLVKLKLTFCYFFRPGAFIHNYSRFALLYLPKETAMARFASLSIFIKHNMITNKTTPSFKFLKSSLTLMLLLLIGNSCFAQKKASRGIVNIVYTSDAHYGVKRKTFRGDSNVVANVVNAAMITQINTLPNLTLPQDGGILAGSKVDAVDYLIQSGDIANRMEIPYQSAAADWAQFKIDYMQGPKLKGHNGQPAQLLLLPGNHDISNAIGFYKPMQPLTDPSAMVNIYNLILSPKTPMTNAAYDYSKDKINYSRNIHGVHFMFITLWPDSAERIWMQQDLDTVSAKTPVIVFTHDQPISEAVHFTNPVAPYQIATGSKFENLLAEHYKDAGTVAAEAPSTNIEQRGWVRFLKLHPNIVAYFHGNSNWNEFYDYTGPDNDVDLKVFRVDSPMKGKLSAKDEKLLSFQLITLDPVEQKLTVRECLWNSMPTEKNQAVAFGKSITISIKAPAGK